MRFFVGHTSARRTLALILVTTLTAGCMSWQPAPGNPRTLIDQGPNRVRITTAQAEPFVLYAPKAEGTELTGLLRNGDQTSRMTTRLRDVRFVETRRVDRTRTELLVGAVVVTGAVFGIVKLVRVLDNLNLRSSGLHLFF